MLSVKLRGGGGAQRVMMLAVPLFMPDLTRFSSSGLPARHVFVDSLF
jgi:hypothetical protein